MADQEYQTIQQYVAILFDELQPIYINPEFKNTSMVNQLSNYGRKIMQLSQQSTFKYRNEHFLPRKEVQKDLSSIYRLVVGQQSEGEYQTISKALLDKLEFERKSIWMKQSLPQSRLIPLFELKSQEQRTKNNNMEEQKSSLRASKTRSKARASRVSTVKQVLQVKHYFEQEEASIRQFYDKIGKMLEINKVPISSLQPQNLKFSRAKTQNISEKIEDIIRVATDNNAKNISNVCHLVELLHDNMQKRLKNEGTANNKLETFFSQVKRMEEVYSYTLSKLLEKMAIVKGFVRENPSTSLEQIQSVEQIMHKLYGLFPTSQVLQNILVSAEGAKQTRSYGVQINLLKGTSQKKNGSQTFRLQIKVNEIIDKFQRSMKFKKTLEVKEIQKLFECIRQLVPSSKNLATQDSNYQEEFKKLIDLQERRQKQLLQSSSKKQKKLQKKIVELQQVLEQLSKEKQKVSEQWQKQAKKLNKKIQQEQAEYKKLASQKAHLEVNISQMLKQIEKMKDSVRRQSNEEVLKRMELQKERQQLAESNEASKKKLSQNLQELKIQKQRITQQRTVYRQKIQLTQKQLQQERQLSAGLKIQFQAFLSQNNKLKTQQIEMASTYEQKIKQVEEMIQSIKQLQEIKQEQENSISKLNSKVETANQLIFEQNKNIQDQQSQIDRLSMQNSQLKKQVQKWKEEGRLTDSDLKTLKEEVDKVNTAYLEAQNVIELLKEELAQANEQKQKLFKEKFKLSRTAEDLEAQLHSLKTRNQSLELSERDMKDQYYQKCQQNNRISKQIEQLRKQVFRIKKELSEQRQERSKSDRQLRQMRQDIQSKKQSESAEQGKRRLQLENMRVELRKKNQQLQKQRESYEERLGIMTQRLQEMEQSMGQKQLLSRLLQHQTQ